MSGISKIYAMPSLWYLTCGIHTSYNIFLEYQNKVDIFWIIFTETETRITQTCDYLQQR